MTYYDMINFPLIFHCLLPASTKPFQGNAGTRKFHENIVHNYAICNLNVYYFTTGISAFCLYITKSTAFIVIYNYCLVTYIHAFLLFQI